MKIKVFTISVGIVALLAACGGKSGISTDDVNNPATASGNYDPETQPKMEFAETEFNFGTITDGDRITHTFKFKNTGKSNLIISDVGTSCGCTVASKPEDPILPGAESEIVAEFNSTHKASATEVEKVITVFANTNPNSIKLKLKGFVKK